MYLEIDEGFPGHRKTLRMCSLMRNPEAGWYMIRLWTWACRSCPSGSLVGFTSYDLEMACQYRELDGKCFAAMAEAGFIDVDDHGPVGIHGWMEHTGGAIKRMANKASENKARREEARARHESAKGESRTGTVLVQSENRTGINPTKTRQDKTSPDKTSQEREEEPPAPPPNEPGKPTPRNVVDMYLRLRAELVVGHVQGANGIFQQPQPGDVAKASEWLASVAPEECADIEPAIRLACQHVADGSQGWARPEMAKVGYLFGCIVRSWPDLREELHGCAPKLKTVDRNGKTEREPEVTPVREW
jgi:hypothetical protein